MRTLHHTWSINAQLTFLVNSSRKLKSQLPWKSDSFLLRDTERRTKAFKIAKLCYLLPAMINICSTSPTIWWMIFFLFRTACNLFVIQPFRYHVYMFKRKDLFYFARGSCLFCCRLLFIFSRLLLWDEICRCLHTSNELWISSKTSLSTQRPLLVVCYCWRPSLWGYQPYQQDRYVHVHPTL